MLANLVPLGDESVLTEKRARRFGGLIDFVAGLLDCLHFGFQLRGTALCDDGDHVSK
jgi:hypothetical protein